MTLDVSTGFTAPRLAVVRPLVLPLSPPVSAGSTVDGFDTVRAS
jgi:hypothetical protein